jgi:hypothetical protein
MLAIVTSVLRRQLSTAWSAWRSYTLRKRQQQQDLQEVGAACPFYMQLQVCTMQCCCRSTCWLPV